MSAVQTAATGPTRSTDDAPSFESFEQLYAATRDAVYAYVMGLLRDRDAAEEVTAQAFERAFRKRGRIDRERGDARAWLFGIARNAALDELRRLKRHATPTEPAALARIAGSGETPDDALRIALHDALATLKTRDRELVALKYFAGLTNREIAAVTDQTESNVGTRLSRIITTLRSAL
jgi:RNA polymerase sigma-70 factor (ECF subfamily)